ncbi:MAG: UDP-N-acetylmuramoyl-L-alanyl-D-glutamate--2,6-diaminopimelate ligase [Candidatus Omnitrophica bacterium]|nr:UDP-N-acetylmuramoyl-L-alanyl-D-glutamate--2,6-diaminopimelate ligase [Candidatus Omnitrophota bacterium]MDD5440826.1 UDP-N-acetylmuramoyl-L-alanyl-D-glutamate--2,6-diaminopimelate ligase [Candidatus Omnitrophota bacterium]
MKRPVKTVAELLGGASVDKSIARYKVSVVTDDTRKIVKGRTLFFMRAKENFDVLEKLGCIAADVYVIITGFKDFGKVSKLVSGKCKVLGVKNIDNVYFSAIDRLYEFSNKDFVFIGVTGTNGKTTVAGIIYHLLNKLGFKASLIGTVDNIIAGSKSPAVNTTPDYTSLREMLFESRIKGYKHIVMEVSSHGIVQDRIKGLNFAVKIFTNLSRDHIDYHKNMANYFLAKKSFMEAGKYGDWTIVNLDDRYGRKIKLNGKSRTYAVKRDADCRAVDIFSWDKGVRFKLKTGEDDTFVNMSILGAYNVYNVMAAVAAVSAVTGLCVKEFCQYVKTFKGVKGRLTAVCKDIFLDYAHTPDALKKVLQSVKMMGYDNIILVFGCGGNRDKGKRAIMGAVAGRYADFTVVTSDNPRDEDPADICHQIACAINGRHKIMIDRRQAIGYAVKQNKRLKNSCVVVAGKGHEVYQVVGAKKISFSDEEVIKEFCDI